MNNQILAMAVAGAAVGYLTGAMNIRDDMTSAILGGVIGLGIGYAYSSLGSAVPMTALAAPQQTLALAAPAGSSYAL